MESMDDDDNAEELTFKAINETINYINSFVNSDSLEMSLPWNVWNITFKNKADKLFYAKTFLETLKTWVDDEHNSISFLKIWLIWWSVAWGFLLIHKIFKSLNPIAAALNFWKKIFSKWKTETSSETKWETTTETKVEKSSEYVSREKMESYVQKVEEKYLSKQTAKNHNKMFVAIKSLKRTIASWKLDKITEIQFWTIIEHLAKKNTLPRNISWNFADFLKGKIWDWNIVNDYIWEKVKTTTEVWKDGIKIDNERKIDIKKTRDFLDKLWSAEEKFTVEFWWETIEVKESIVTDLEKIESKWEVLKELEKGKNLQNKLKLLDAELSDIKTEIGTLDKTLTKWKNTIPNPDYTSIKWRQTKVLEAISKINADYIELWLTWDIKTIDIETKINTVTTEIDTSINKIKSELKSKTIAKIWTIKTSSRVRGIQKAIIKAIKK